MFKFQNSQTAKFFKADERGTTIVEFAMIAPLMIMLFLGTVSLGHGLNVDRRVTNLASAAADLVAQTDEVDNTGLNQIFQASETYLRPFGTSGLKITVTSIVADADGVTTVDWSCGYQGGTTYAQGNAYTLPNGLISPFASIVVAEVSYDYVAPVRLFNFISSFYSTATAGKDSFTMNETFYLRPRRSLKVTKTDAGNCQLG